MSIRSVFFALLLVATFGCGNGRKEYKDFNEYPVRTGDMSEMSYTSGQTVFTLWAPTAEDVRVMLYDSGEEGNAYKILKLEPGEEGTWTGAAIGDLKGKFYTFNVKVNEKWLGDTPGIMAKAVGINGKRAAIINMKETDPQGWEKDVRPAAPGDMQIFLYGLHYRDFSSDTTSGIKYQGKYLALTESGTKNTFGLATGIDHLKELGVTHVQLSPSYDFSSIDESLTEKEQYSRGNNPLNYNIPEGSYSTDARKPEIRIREFKQMVQTLHQAGVRVVMEVAYSYTSGGAAGNFERTVPGYFHRQNPDGTFVEVSGFGNQIAGERPMVRKFMIESLLHWVNEYHIDGFCFDQVGMHDVETMNEIRKAVNSIDPTIIICGRGSVASDSLATNADMVSMPGIFVFNDELSIYNNGRCLLDGLRKNSPENASIEELLRLNKLAQAVTFTSQGIPFICAGEEIMGQKKGLAHAINWNNKELYKDMFDYCKGLVSLRKQHPAFRMKNTAEVRKHLEFLPVEGNGLIAYRLKDHAGGDKWEEVIVVLNGNKVPDKVNVPEGKYTVVCKDGVIGLNGIGQTSGGEILVPEQSALIIYR